MLRAPAQPRSTEHLCAGAGSIGAGGADCASDASDADAARAPSAARLVGRLAKAGPLLDYFIANSLLPGCGADGGGAEAERLCDAFVAFAALWPAPAAAITRACSAPSRKAIAEARARAFGALDGRALAEVLSRSASSAGQSVAAAP